MAKTQIGDVSNLIQKYWAPVFMKELRKSIILPNLVNKEYSGSIVKGGDTVKVSIVKALTGQSLTIGTDAMAFTPETVQTTTVDLKCEKVLIASVEIDNIVDIQSQLEAENSELRAAMVFGVMDKLNSYLYSKVNPSTAAPDHLLNSQATMGNSDILAIRKLAAQAKWAQDKGWYSLLDPQYMNDLLASQTIVSSDFVGDQPVVGGQIASKRYGFQIYEDNSLQAGRGLFFHPDFMLFAMQQEPTFELSSKHSSKELGYVLSVSLVCGAALSPEGNKKHIVATTEAVGFTLP